MAIAFTNLGASVNPDISSSANTTSYANSSWTPPTTGIILLMVESRMATNNPAAPPEVPSVSGNGLTWVELATITWFVSGGINRGRLTWFAADASGASTGATTIDFDTESQVQCHASFIHATGVDISGGVASVAVQSASDDWSSPPDAEPSITLASGASHADNRCISGWGFSGDTTLLAPRDNWTEMDDQLNTGPNTTTETQVREDAFEQTASLNIPSQADTVGIVIELKADTGGGSAYSLVLDHGSFVLTGNALALGAGRKIAAVQGSYALTGQDTGVFYGRNLVAVQGSYALTGNDSSLGLGRKVSFEQGSYILTGQDTSVIYGRNLLAGQASYSLTGQDTSLGADRSMALSHGSYSLDGQDTGLLKGFFASLESGSYVLEGQDVSLGADRNLSLANGSYVLNGQELQSIRDYLLSLGQANFSLNGQDSLFTHGLNVSLAHGAYVLEGQDMFLAIGYALPLNYGSYALSGYAVSLVYSGSGVVEPDSRRFRAWRRIARRRKG